MGETDVFLQEIWYGRYLKKILPTTCSSIRILFKCVVDEIMNLLTVSLALLNNLSEGSVG